MKPARDMRVTLLGGQLPLRSTIGAAEGNLWEGSERCYRSPPAGTLYSNRTVARSASVSSRTRMRADMM